jgi:ankyrin repeat protein
LCHTQHGRTALHAAAEKGHLEVAKTLITSGADIKAQDKARQQAHTRTHARRGA